MLLIEAYFNFIINFNYSFILTVQQHDPPEIHSWLGSHRLMIPCDTWVRLLPLGDEWPWLLQLESMLSVFIHDCWPSFRCHHISLASSSPVISWGLKARSRERCSNFQSLLLEWLESRNVPVSLVILNFLIPSFGLWLPIWSPAE